MKINLPKGYSQYGAQMGRTNKTVKGRCHLQKLIMSSCGAYDQEGAYWGLGRPLYVCQDKDKNQFFVRAWTRESAKAQVLFWNNEVTFYK